MLNDDVMEVLGDRLVNRINFTNEQIIKQLAKNISLFKNLNTTEAHQLAQILKFGGDFNKIRKKIAELTKLNLEDIDAIFREVAKKNQNFAKQFYDYKKVKFIPYEQNKALKQQVEAFKTTTANEYMSIANSRVIGYVVKDAKNNLVFKDLKAIYNEVIDRAALSIVEGKETFDKSLFDLMKDIGQSGLRCVEYESGLTRRLDSAVRMNMMSGIRNMSNHIQEEFGKEYGADGVEITTHSHPAPDHALVQGRQLSYEEYNKLQETGKATTYDKIKIDMYLKDKSGKDYKSFRPISEYNCYHNVFHIVLGVSSPEYSNKELQQILIDDAKGFELDGKHYTLYQGTQMQRQLETRIREQKDIQIIGVNMNNEEGNKLIADSQKKITELTRKYKELSFISGLPIKKDRLRVSNYKRTKV